MLGKVHSLLNPKNRCIYCDTACDSDENVATVYAHCCAVFRGSPSTLNYTKRTKGVSLRENWPNLARFTLLVRRGTKNQIYVERISCADSSSVWHVGGKEVSGRDWLALPNLADELGTSYLPTRPIERIIHVVRVWQDDCWAERWSNESLDQHTWWDVTSFESSNLCEKLSEYVQLPVCKPVADALTDALTNALLELVDPHGRLDLSRSRELVKLAKYIIPDSLPLSGVTVLDLSNNSLHLQELPLVQNLVSLFPDLTFIDLSRNLFDKDDLSSFEYPHSCTVNF